MRKRKPKKTSKSYSFYNPLNLIERINTFNDMRQEKQLPPNATLPLNPKDLTRTQQNLVIEFKKYSESLSNVEIALYLGLHRGTIGSRLKIIDEEHRQELEDNGLSVWEVVYQLKRACEYVKQRARVLNKPELYWKATLDFIDQCQKLGVIHEKPKELEINYPIHSEEDEKIIIAHYRRIELGLPIPSEEDLEVESVKLVPEQPDE